MAVRTTAIVVITIPHICIISLHRRPQSIWLVLVLVGLCSRSHLPFRKPRYREARRLAPVLPSCRSEVVSSGQRFSVRWLRFSQRLMLASEINLVEKSEENLLDLFWVLWEDLVISSILIPVIGTEFSDKKAVGWGHWSLAPGHPALRTGHRHCPGGHLNNDDGTRCQHSVCCFLSLFIAVWLSHHHHRMGGCYYSV